MMNKENTIRKRKRHTITNKRNKIIIIGNKQQRRKNQKCLIINRKSNLRNYIYSLKE